MGDLMKRGLTKQIGDTGFRVETGAQWPWTFNLLCGEECVASFDFTGWRLFRAHLLTPESDNG